MITAFRPHGDPAGYSPVIRVECFSTPVPTAATCTEKVTTLVNNTGTRHKRTIDTDVCLLLLANVHWAWAIGACENTPKLSKYRNRSRHKILDTAHYLSGWRFPTKIRYT